MIQDIFRKIMDKKIYKTLEFDKILIKLSSFMTTVGAKENALDLEIETDKKELEIKLNEVSEAESLILSFGKPSFFDDSGLDEILKRLPLIVTLTEQELLLIASLLDNAGELKKYEEEALSNDGKISALSEYFENLYPLKNLSKEIHRSINADGEVADDASSELKSIRKELSSKNGKIRDTLQKSLSKYGEFLSDSIVTQKGGRYVIPVKAENKTKVPGIVHDSSQSGQTLFVEPISVVEAGNEIRELENKEREEVLRILAALSKSCAIEIEYLKSNLNLIETLDFIFGKAQYSVEIGGVKPKFVELKDIKKSKNKKIDEAYSSISLDEESIKTEGESSASNGKAAGPAEQGKSQPEIEFLGARHPLIDKEKIVPVDIIFDGTYRVLVITGPNTGGKTVSLKTLGLLSLMALSGLFVPCEKATLPYFKNIFADIGDEQSIEESLSTFSGHMRNIVNIVTKAKTNDLILFDELCAGTDPAEGSALAVSILEELRRRGAFVMATTHYAELKTYALTEDGVKNASMEFDAETMEPTYKLVIGLPGKSNAFAISKKLGLYPSILNDAKRRMDSEAINMENLLADIERQRRRLQSEADRQKNASEILDRRLQKLEEREKKTSEKNDAILKEANEKASNILKDAKAQYDAAIRELNKIENGQYDMKELEKRRAALRSGAKNKDEKAVLQANNVSKKRKKLKPSELHIGDFVNVLTMEGVKGTVHKLPDSKGNLEVKMGIITSKVNIEDIELIEDESVTFEGNSVPSTLSKKNKEAKKSLKAAYNSVASRENNRNDYSTYNKALTVSPEVQLLGMDSSEAINTLDKYIDDAVIAGLPEIRIVHGKGTGVLRNAVSSYLRRDSRIKSFRLGEYGEGDAGVTIAELK